MIRHLGFSDPRRRRALKMGSLGDGRDVDEEIRLEEMEEVVGEEQEENLSNFVLSWTLEDVLNKDLLKEKRSRPEHSHSGRDLYDHSNECKDHGKLKRKQGETDEQESHVCCKPRFNCENSAHSFHYREHCLGSECHRDSQATETHSLMEGEARHGSTATKNSQYTPSTGELPVSQQIDIQTNKRSIPKVPSPTRNRGCHSRFSQYPDISFGRKWGYGTTQPQWSRTGSDVGTQRESSTRDINCSIPTQSSGYRGMHHQGECCYRREDSTRDTNSSRPTQSPGPRGMHHQGEPWYHNFYVDDQNRMCGRVKPLGRSSFNSNNQSHYERPPQGVWDGPRNVWGNTPQREGFRCTQRSINRDRQHSFSRNQKVSRLEQVIGHEGSKDSSSWGEWPECGNHGVIRHKQSVGLWGEWPDSGKQGVIGHEESLASSRWEWPASGKQGVIGQVSSSREGWPKNVKQEMIGQEESAVPSSWGEWPENLKQEVIRQEESIVCSSRGGWPENVKQEVIGQEEFVVSSSWWEWPESVKPVVIDHEEPVVSSSWEEWPESVKYEV